MQQKLENKCSAISLSRHFYLISIIWQILTGGKIYINLGSEQKPETQNLARSGEQLRLGSDTSGGRVGVVGGPLGLTENYEIVSSRRLQLLMVGGEHRNTKTFPIKTFKVFGGKLSKMMMCEV